MEQTYCLTKTEILQIINSLETMLEIFESQMISLTSAQRNKFLQSKDHIHRILQSAFSGRGEL